MDGKGNLWYISGFTLCKYREAQKSTTYYDVNKHFEATAICTAFDGTIWASTPLGLLEHYNTADDSFTAYNVFNHSAPAVSKWIEKIYGTTAGTILIGTSNQGAKSFNIATGTYKDILTYNSDKTALFVRSFVQTSESEFWIGTESGIFIYNTESDKVTNLKKAYNNPYSISDNAVYTFCKDKEGGIWAGTYFGGANYYPKQYTFFQKFFPKVGENSLSGNVVREIKQDEYGNLWIGTEDAGLNKLDRTTGRFTHFAPTGTKGSISYSNIHGLLVNGNELWIGTFEHGLDVMDIKTEKVVRHYEAGASPTSLKSNFIYAIYRTNAGEVLLATTRGAYSYNRQQDNFTPLPGMPLNNWYTSLLKDEKGIIWAGTYGNGVNYYNTITKQSGNFRYNTSGKKQLKQRQGKQYI